MGKWNSDILAKVLKYNTQANKERAEKSKQANERMKESVRNILKNFKKKENDKK